jgi:hypothetical protein
MVTDVTVRSTAQAYIHLTPAVSSGLEVHMKLKNIGKADRIIRIALGLAIAVLGIAFKNWLGLIAIIPLATAAVSTCPLYLPFGISTRAKAKA